MRNILLVIAYDGSAFYGYQEQLQLRTVQGELKQALYQMHGGVPVEFHVAGRTDRGVHADGQCINVQTTIDAIPADRFAAIINTFLPVDIRAVASREVSASFHARYSARWRLYRYSYCLAPVVIPQQRLYISQLGRPIDIKRVKAELKQVEGSHNFASFCKQAGNFDVKSLVRTVRYTDIVQTGSCLYIYISANGFLRGMVRAIAGTIIEREIKRQQGEVPSMSMHDILERKNRSYAGTTAPPQGLTLLSVEYDE